MRTKRSSVREFWGLIREFWWFIFTTFPLMIQSLYIRRNIPSHTILYIYSYSWRTKKKKKIWDSYSACLKISPISVTVFLLQSGFTKTFKKYLHISNFFSHVFSIDIHLTFLKMKFPRKSKTPPVENASTAPQRIFHIGWESQNQKNVWGKFNLKNEHFGGKCENEM